MSFAGKGIVGNQIFYMFLNIKSLCFFDARKSGVARHRSHMRISYVVESALHYRLTLLAGSVAVNALALKVICLRGYKCYS